MIYTNTSIEISIFYTSQFLKKKRVKSWCNVLLRPEMQLYMYHNLQTYILKYVCEKVENILGIGEIADLKYFPLFITMVLEALRSQNSTPYAV